MSVVRFVRLHADGAGESHMDTEELGIKSSAFAPPAPPLGVSTMEPAAGWRFLHLPSGGWGTGTLLRSGYGSSVSRETWSSRRVTGPCSGSSLEVPYSWKTPRVRGTRAG